MKKLLFVFLAISLAIAAPSCTTSKSLATTTSDSDGSSTTDRDGSSYEKAVIVNSIRDEYDWVRQRYPQAQMVQQALMFEKKKPYDLLTFRIDGKERTFYFDISKFYGKGFE